MHATVKAQDGKVIVAVPAEWEDREVEVDIHPVNAADAILESLDKTVKGKRIETKDWKFDRDAVHDRSRAQFGRVD